MTILRDKLARQQSLKAPEREKYTTYANLGTTLTFAHLHAALAGDADARRRFKEGSELIRMAIKANPEAHFGREKWQAASAEYFVAVFDDPKLLRKFDFLGNHLGEPVKYILNREVESYILGYGRPYDGEFGRFPPRHAVPEYFDPGTNLEAADRWPALRPVREHITKIGAEGEWEKAPVKTHTARVAFDEPMLAIVGMWRQGEGANPHFALAIGETMLRVGQRYIAWAAFERADRLADHFASDAETRQFLKDHCRQRQQDIEATLRFRRDPESRYRQWQEISPPPDPKVVDDLRKSFDAELAFGEAFQREYQEYEAKKIIAGGDIDLDSFYDDFYSGSKTIASPTGSEEWFVWVSWEKRLQFARNRATGWAAASAGGIALLLAVYIRWRDSRRSRLSQ